MFSTKSTIRLTGAFAALAALALAASCQGFFPHATLQSITVSPNPASVAVNATLPMQAWGTDTNNNRYQLGTSNGLQWSLSSPSVGTVATISAAGVLSGQNAGTITVTASAQGLTGSTTATVVEVVTGMTISPSSATVTADGGVTYAGYTIKDQSGNNISSLVTLTGELNGTVQSGITCGYQIGLSGDGTNDCTAASGLVNSQTTYTILVTYAGYTGTPVSALLVVNP